MVDEMDPPKGSHVCDCIDECPTHPNNRWIHVGDECLHVDGTRHKIYRKSKKT